jgi:hypothetical protein
MLGQVRQPDHDHDGVEDQERADDQDRQADHLLEAAQERRPQEHQ